MTIAMSMTNSKAVLIFDIVIDIDTLTLYL